jgi:hypothetical protein
VDIAQNTIDRCKPGQKMRALTAGLAGAFVASAAFGGYLYFQRYGSILPLADQEVARCEYIVKKQLKAPSTYRRTKYVHLGDEVHIIFDAANSYGTPIQSVANCKAARLPAGGRDTEHFETVEVDGIAVEKQYIDIYDTTFRSGAP